MSCVLMSLVLTSVFARLLLISLVPASCRAHESRLTCWQCQRWWEKGRGALFFLGCVIFVLSYFNFIFRDSSRAIISSPKVFG